MTSFDANYKFSSCYDKNITSDKSLDRNDETDVNDNVNADMMTSERYTLRTSDTNSGTSSISITDISEKPSKTGSSDVIIQAEIETDKKYLAGAKGQDLNSRHSLEVLINRVKSEYGIKHMLVWHTLMGYWGGVHVDPDARTDTNTDAVVRTDRWSDAGWTLKALPFLSPIGAGWTDKPLPFLSRIPTLYPNPIYPPLAPLPTNPHLSRSSSSHRPPLGKPPLPPPFLPFNPSLTTLTSPPLLPTLFTPSPLASYLPTVTYPMMTATMQRMSVANALDSEPFMIHGIGNIYHNLFIIIAFSFLVLFSPFCLFFVFSFFFFLNFLFLFFPASSSVRSV